MKPLKLFILTALSGIIGIAGAQNLIRNPEFDNPLNDEVRFSSYPRMQKYSIYTEETNWNKCLKLEVLEYREHPETKSPFHWQSVRVGGDKEKGIPVKPGTVYNYSLELKGDVDAYIFIMEWNDPDPKKEAKKLKELPPVKGLTGKEWRIIRGTFQTGPNARYAAIRIDIAGYMAHTLPKIGGCLLIDKVYLSEKADLPEAFRQPEKAGPPQSAPIKKVISPDVEVRGFVDIKSNKTPSADTRMFFSLEAGFLRLTITCLEPYPEKIKAAVKQDGLSDVWNDDNIEIFFAPVKADRSFSQLVIGAGGGRWMSYGIAHTVREFDQWQAQVSLKDNCWTAVVRIPCRLLGWDGNPAPDTAIGFNVVRNRTPVRESTAWNFPDGNPRNVNGFGVLLGSSPEQWFQLTRQQLVEAAQAHQQTGFLGKIEQWQMSSEPGKTYHESIALKNELKIQSLKDVKFVVTAINPAADPTIPLLPEGLADPPGRITLRAAGNEFKPLPLAITNLTDRLEEYRLEIDSFNPADTRSEHGLKSASGGRFPPEKLTLYRGIRVKDGDEANHGLRYDPLAPMDVTRTFIVAPKEATPVWAVFDTAGVSPGKYSGAIRVTPLGLRAEKLLNPKKFVTPKTYDIPFELEVLPFELDRKYPMAQSFFSYGYKNPKIVKQLFEFGCYGLWLSPWSVNISFHPDGSVAKRDISDLVDEVRFYKKTAEEYGLSDEFLAGFGIGSYMIFRTIHAKDRFKFGTAEWTRAWKNFVAAIEDIRKESGLDNKNFFLQVVDEVKAGDLEEAMAATRIVHEMYPEMNIFLTLAPWQIPENDLAQFIPYVKYWCFWSTKYFIPEYENLMKKLRAAGKHISFYTCETTMRLSLQKYYRAHAWTALAYHLDMAAMYVHIDNLYFLRDWREGTFGSFARMAGDTPITSIRMECLRIGQNDLRYYRKLSELFGESEIKSPGLKREIQHFLDSTPGLLGIKEPYDANLAEAAREKMIDYILLLLKQ